MPGSFAANVHEPGRILDEATALLDFTRPIALMLLGIMGHVADHAEAVAIVRRLVGALPAGSYMVLTDGLDTDPAGVESMRQYNATGANPYTLRGPDQLAAFFAGLEILEPGLVPLDRWRPAPVDATESVTGVPSLCGVARKT